MCLWSNDLKQNKTTPRQTGGGYKNDVDNNPSIKYHAGKTR